MLIETIIQSPDKDEIVAMLADANGRATRHAYTTLSEIQACAEDAEKELADLSPKPGGWRVLGIKLVASGGAIAGAAARTAASEVGAAKILAIAQEVLR